jgi:hypothetical protein
VIESGLKTEEVSAVDGVEVFREPGDLQLPLLHERKMVQYREARVQDNEE